MSQPVTALTASSCPLLPPEAASLISQFNAALARLSGMESRFPRLSGEFAALREELTTAHTELSATHYRVGFLGTTAAGKSTTFNNVLDVTEADAPAKSGSGLATTATITRLRRVEPGIDNSLTVTFLSTEEYEHKRRVLMEACEFSPIKPDRELLSELETIGEKIDRGAIRGKPGDFVNLRLLIKSRQSFSSDVAPAPKSQVISYADRGAWLNHAVPSVPGKTRLLSNALLEFRNDRIPGTLELIDLPGLGASALDTDLTVNYLPRLNGVLIFVNAIQLDDSNVQEILKHMRIIFKEGWAKRVWIVLTKFGALTKNGHFDSERTWFDDITASIKGHGTLVENLFIVDNPFYDEAKSDPASMPKKSFLARPVDDPKYGRHPEFRFLFEQAMLDGGIKNLREFLTKRLAVTVGEELRAATQVKLNAISLRLEYLEEAEKRRTEMNDEQREQAYECRNTVRKLIDDLDLVNRPAEYRKAIRELVAKFETTIRKTIPEAVWPTMNPETVRKEFPALTRSLDRASQISRQDFLQVMQEQIAQALKGLPAVPISEGDSPLAAWTKLSMADALGGDWNDRFPAFANSDLLQRIDPATQQPIEIEGGPMRKVIQTKVELVASSNVHIIRTRLRDRLRLLYRDLSALVTN